MITLSLIVSVYYNVILALTFFYFFASVYGLFEGELPWAKCGHDWNVNCLERQHHSNGNNHNNTVATCVVL